MATELPRVRARLPAAFVGAVVGPDEVWLAPVPVGPDSVAVAVAFDEAVGATLEELVLEADLLVLDLVEWDEELEEEDESSPSSEEPSVLTMMLPMVPELSP
jgi:hypothetical protein